MLDPVDTFRDFEPGIGRAVADRTIARTIERPYRETAFIDIEIPRNDDMSLHAQVNAEARNLNLTISGFHVVKGDDLTVKVTLYATGEVRRESWVEIADRVALGNCSLHPSDFHEEHRVMRHAMRKGVLLMSGRHLQHGDADQARRPGEVFTNCLEGSTRILTMEFGPIEIEKVAGQEVTVIAGDGRPRRATIYEHGEQELYQYVFRANASGGGKLRHIVRATANHRWLLRDGSVTEDLMVGDVLRPTNPHVGVDAEAVVHGVIFGDGSAHKSRHDHGRTAISQGRSYASIRVCKQDQARDEIQEWLDDAGLKFSCPPSAGGDRIYYGGKMPYVKEVPFTRDPEYIAGFIYGWWLADGAKSKDVSALEISTSNEVAAAWLEEHAGYAGYNITMHRVIERKEGDGSYCNGKPLHYIRLRKNVEWKVDSIKPAGRANVYCPEEPVTSSFVLANGLLTGNCAVAPATFLSFYLLLNGAGVGRDYSDAMISVDYAQMPIVVPTIEWSHPDVAKGLVQARTIEEVKHLYADRKITVFSVPDSREGFAEAVAMIEAMAYERRRHEVLILDFTQVRQNGALIGGMQNRPASGPAPLMSAIENMARLRDAGMAPWRSTLYADHFFAEVVLVGGARRAARMSTKWWRDPEVLDFITVKRAGKFLWSSNNSVTVDAEFWKLVNEPLSDGPAAEHVHAHAVFIAVCDAAYHDGTGEPGFINVDRFDDRIEDENAFAALDSILAGRLNLPEVIADLLFNLRLNALASPYRMITNPCGEICLMITGGYCTIADVAFCHADTLDELETALRAGARALIRTNLMSFLFDSEVKRTNRIGVGPTGLHEFALKFFGFGWKDLIDEGVSIEFWETMGHMSRAVKDEARRYSKKLGVVVPHTDTTAKPSGCASLDTTIKTRDGVLTMRQLFAINGYDENFIRSEESGSWLAPKRDVLVMDENNEEKMVTKLYVNGVQPVFEITFEDGMTVKLTEEHRLKTADGWKMVKDLTEQDEILHFAE